MYQHMPVARTVRIMHRARECKVHAEQTSRPDASEWTELRASLPPSPTPSSLSISTWCTRAYVHMCASGVLKDTRAEDTKYSRRVLTSHEKESRFFPSSLIFRASSPSSAGFLRVSHPLLFFGDFSLSFSLLSLLPCIIPVSRIPCARRNTRHSL